jgi:hypothetical protein
MIYEEFFLELEKIGAAARRDAWGAESPVKRFPHSGSSVEIGLKAAPRDLGIYDKKTGENDRRLAYLHKVPKVVGIGAIGGLASGLVLGKSPLTAVSKKGRGKLVKSLSEDVSAVSGIPATWKRSLIKGVVRKTRHGPRGPKSVRDVAKNLPKEMGALSPELRREIHEKGVKEVLKRLKKPALKRGKATAITALTGAAVAAAPHVAKNITQYEWHRGITGKGIPRKEMKVRKKELRRAKKAFRIKTRRERSS